MRALNKKLVRDFRRLWLQSLAIAMVLAAGIGILLMSYGMYLALSETRAAYYERNRFADIFVQVKRAPVGLAREVQEIPGVLTAEPRITELVILDVPGRIKASVGQMISLPESGDPPLLNVPILRSGRFPDPGSTDEVAVNEPFALAHKLAAGDVIHANLNGRKRPLTITGTLLSPEFIYALGPGSLMPDNEAFGILWAPEPMLKAAFNMDGAFNDLSLRLSRTARSAEVIDAVDDLLGSYGGLGAHDRTQQLSHSFIDAELKQLRLMSIVLPPVFFAISAFLVNMVIGRIVSLDRSEIGLFKALGYSNLEVSLHYLYLSLLIGVIGIVGGWALGAWLSRALANLYAQFFTFPYVIFRVTPAAYLLAGGIAAATTILGAYRSARAAALLPPAEAMNPPTPPHYRHTLLDRFWAFLRLAQPTLMIIRGLQRWPLRAGLTALGLALAVAVLVASSFYRDSMDEIIDLAFFQSMRQDAMLVFNQDLPIDVLDEVRALPGVLAVEGQQQRMVVLHNGPREKRVSLEARPREADLNRIIDSKGKVVASPPDGLLLSERLARQLGLGRGDMVGIEFLDGRRETVELPLVATVRQYLGLGAYVEEGTLNRIAQQAPRASIANVSLDPAHAAEFHRATKEIPMLASTAMLVDARKGFQDTIDENISIVMAIYAVVAILITVGVTYNSSRIQLSERQRDLASLKILGFSTLEVSYIFVGETVVVALVAQPLGWLLGTVLATAMTKGFDSDLYTVPLVLERDTFAYASLVVLTAAIASAMIVRRKLDRLDLVAVMKTRE